MLKNTLFASVALLAGSLVAADSNPKDDVKAAAEKLAAKSNSCCLGIEVRLRNCY